MLHHPYCCYVNIPITTGLHIPLAHPCLYYYLLSPQYAVLHISFYCTYYSLFYKKNYLYLYIYSCVVLHILHCPLSGPELIYISLHIIFCIIVHVTNKKEPWTFNNLVKKYNLKGKYNFLKYLQIRYCVSTKIQHTDENYILDFLSLPRPQKKSLCILQYD